MLISQVREKQHKATLLRVTSHISGIFPNLPPVSPDTVALPLDTLSEGSRLKARD